MIIEIQHETTLRYSEQVSDWLAELRVQPFSDAEQSCQSFSLKLSEHAAIHRYRDGFGNQVHHFNLRRPNREVRALAAAVVETHPQIPDWSSSRSVGPIHDDNLPLATYDFLRLRGPVRATPSLEPLLNEIAPPKNMRIIDVVQRISRYIFSNFEYAKAVTNASSPIDDVLAARKGVCQDFAHLMIAILRSFQIPARYVSGYVHRPNKESQSHAWCEAWVPDLGWIGIDPTNNTPAGDHHVKVAFGRDFSDVPPNKGLYRGNGEESIFARVETRELDRLPSLSWQEQLPPLHVPLMMVKTQRHHDSEFGDVEQQQQQ